MNSQAVTTAAAVTGSPASQKMICYYQKSPKESLWTSGGLTHTFPSKVTWRLLPPLQPSRNDTLVTIPVSANLGKRPGPEISGLSPSHKIPTTTTELSELNFQAYLF